MSTPLHTAIERIIAWNEARYDRVYDPQLTNALLLEEVEEANQAMEADNYLKELMDIAYVAIGALWKYGYDRDEIYELLNPQIDRQVDEEAQHLVNFANLALDRACEDLKLPNGVVVAALLIVCESNDSKPIVKAKPNEKANANNKGPNYIKAEPMLRVLLESHHERV